MQINRWKNSSKSILFITLSVWPIGFLIHSSNVIKNTTMPPGEFAAAMGLATSLALMVAALLFAICLRFFIVPKFISEEQ